MGFFDRLKHKEQDPVPTQSQNFNSTSQQSVGILNLNKGDILDLTKVDEYLNNVRVSAGWDVNAYGQDYDLDLCAILLNEANKVEYCVYYADKRYKGIRLDKDNLTGEGEGDDENIFVNLNKIPSSVSRIVFNVVIYRGAEKRQTLGNVRNAYVRLVDTERGEKEICRYSLSEDGGNNTAVEFAELVRTESGWQFHAIGNYMRANISSLCNQY